jgi:hypothetical protein
MYSASDNPPGLSSCFVSAKQKDRSLEAWRKPKETSTVKRLMAEPTDPLLARRSDCGVVEMVSSVAERLLTAKYEYC